MHKLEVGQLYFPGKTDWPEGCEYNYRSGGHELRMFFPSPTRLEIKQVREGTAKFALLVERGCIFLLSKFGTLPWSDAPYNWYMVPESDRQIPSALEDQEMALLTIVMVNADSGIVEAIRVSRLTPKFSTALHIAIQDQIAAGETRDRYNQIVDQFYEKYPNTMAMVAATNVFN